MTLEEILYGVLVADATVQAYVGARVYNTVVDENAPAPFISFHSISTDAYNHLGSAPDLERKEFEIGCVGRIEHAQAMAEAVKAALGSEYGYLQDQGTEYFEDTNEFRVWLHWAMIG